MRDVGVVAGILDDRRCGGAAAPAPLRQGEAGGAAARQADGRPDRRSPGPSSAPKAAFAAAVAQAPVVQPRRSGAGHARHSALPARGGRIERWACANPRIMTGLYQQAARAGSAMSAPAIIIAAPASGAGKTTVTLGILRALRRRGSAGRLVQGRPGLHRPRLPCRRHRPRRPTMSIRWAMRFETLAGLIEESGRGCDLAGRRRRHGPVRRRCRRHRRHGRHRGPVRPAGRARGRRHRHGRLGGGADRRLPAPSRGCRGGRRDPQPGRQPGACRAAQPRLLRARLDPGAGHDAARCDAWRCRAGIWAWSRRPSIPTSARSSTAAAGHGCRSGSSSTGCSAWRARPASRCSAPTRARCRRSASAPRSPAIGPSPSPTRPCSTAGAARASRCCRSRRWRTRRRTRRAMPSTCRRLSRAARRHARRQRPLPRRAARPRPSAAPSSTANAAATWRSAGR